ncbi:MAG: hypothetical protein CNF01_02105 [Halieaceae bacterium MED-G27]|nr:MAG: hypothetical protein CNF01_02105 [Halieaceae bacterium MED-G27]
MRGFAELTTEELLQLLLLTLVLWVLVGTRFRSFRFWSAKKKADYSPRDERDDQKRVKRGN